jgi:hypothetical protein
MRNSLHQYQRQEGSINFKLFKITEEKVEVERDLQKARDDLVQAKKKADDATATMRWFTTVEKKIKSVALDIAERSDKQIATFYNHGRLVAGYVVGMKLIS